MKEKLKLLFDYQKFEQNERLARIIEDARADSEKKRTELSEETLSEISAAGNPESYPTATGSELFPKQ